MTALDAIELNHPIERQHVHKKWPTPTLRTARSRGKAGELAERLASIVLIPVAVSDLVGLAIPVLVGRPERVLMLAFACLVMLLAHERGLYARRLHLSALSEIPKLLPRPAARAVRRRPARLHQLRTRHRRRVLPPPPTPPTPRRRTVVTPSRDDAVTTVRCPLCTTAFTPTGRQHFCSHACREKAYRRRHHLTPPPVIPPAHARRDVTVYECQDCEQRYHAQQWCPACNRPCRRVGIGGLCPHCDQAVAVEDLTAHHAPTITKRADTHGTSA